MNITNTSKKKIFLIFHGRFPSEKAASLFAAKSAEEFSRFNYEVELIVPERSGSVSSDPYEYYGLERRFNIVRINSKDFFVYSFIPKKISFFLNYLFFSIGVLSFIKKNILENDVIFSNEILPLYFSSFVSKNTFYEMHDFPESKIFLFNFFVKRFKWILIHNKWKTERFVKMFNWKRKNILTLPNAVDLEKFDLKIGKKEARKKLNIESDKKIVIYTGHLYGWKGVDTLLSAAQMFDDGTIFFLIGGTDEDVKKYKAQVNFSHIIFVGHRHHTEIPLWQRAGDCLIIPNTAKEKISKYYTSPMKLFEYMASRTPIVASDIPSIREIVSEKEVIFFEPDSPESLKKSIDKALSSDTENMIESARSKVEEYSWKKRQKRIIDFIQSF